MSEPTEPRTGDDPGAVRAAASAAVAPDPKTAELLAKHAAGEKLSQSEYGLVGAFKRKVNGLFASKGGNGAQPAPSGPGQPARVDPLAAAQAPGDSLPDVPPDPGVCQRTTAAILRRCDDITVRYVERNAVAAGADGALLNRFRTSAALPKADQQLIVDLSPDAAADLGLDPRKMPLWTIVGVLGLHATNIVMCVQELKDMRKKSEVRSPKSDEKKPETIKEPLLPDTQSTL